MCRFHHLTLRGNTGIANEEFAERERLHDNVHNMELYCFLCHGVDVCAASPRNRLVLHSRIYKEYFAAEHAEPHHDQVKWYVAWSKRVLYEGHPKQCQNFAPAC